MKRTALKRKPPQRSPRGPDYRLAARFWHMEVTRGGCAMCRAFPLTPDERAHRGRIEGHHIVPKRWLKNNGYGDRFWDVRNGLGLCRLHHQRHEHRFQTVPRELIGPAAREFIAEIGWARLEVDYR